MAMLLGQPVQTIPADIQVRYLCTSIILLWCLCVCRAPGTVLAPTLGVSWFYIGLYGRLNLNFHLNKWKNSNQPCHDFSRLSLKAIHSLPWFQKVGSNFWKKTLGKCWYRSPCKTWVNRRYIWTNVKKKIFNVSFVTTSVNMLSYFGNKSVTCTFICLSDTNLLYVGYSVVSKQ